MYVDTHRETDTHSWTLAATYVGRLGTIVTVGSIDALTPAITKTKALSHTTETTRHDTKLILYHIIYKEVILYHVAHVVRASRALSDGQCNLVQLTSEVKRVKKLGKDGKPLPVPEWPERSWETRTFGNTEVCIGVLL